MRRRLHPLVSWPIAIFAVLAGACLLAAPVHDALVDLGLFSARGTPAEVNKQFLQVLRRLLLLPLGALFLWFFRPWRGGGFLRFGLRPIRPRSIAIAFGLTFLILLLVLTWQFLMGWLTWEDPLRTGKVLGRLGRYLLAGFLIACIEEWFFRGWMGEFAVKHHGPRLAIFLPCLAYAIVHAFRPTLLNQPVSHDAAGALDALGSWLRYLLDPLAFGPSLIGLWLFALLLTALYRRSGSLWASIGTHAAGVLVLFSYGGATTRWPARTWAGTRLLYDGPVLWGILAAGAWIFWPRGADGRLIYGARGPAATARAVAASPPERGAPDGEPAG